MPRVPAEGMALCSTVHVYVYIVEIYECLVRCYECGIGNSFTNQALLHSADCFQFAVHWKQLVLWIRKRYARLARELETTKG